ncbi:MAG: TadE family protein [Blastocatellia bacterium]|nr:TadE family protein [Blastocatellia bacterium]
MLRRRLRNRGERGATLPELALAGVIFCTASFAVIEFGRLLWTHNALVDATRKGARYAVMNAQNTAAVKNMVVYGKSSATGSDTPIVSGLTTGNVSVTYSGFGVKAGTVEVKITGYQFAFVIPLIGSTLTMGEYKTTLTGESAGQVPAAI